jgi:hypothetical protein
MDNAHVLPRSAAPGIVERAALPKRSSDWML